MAGDADFGEGIVPIPLEQLLEGASDALVRRLAALAYADTELAVLLLGTLGPGSRRYLQRGGALSWQPDEDGWRLRLTDRGRELCKLAAMRMTDRELHGRVEQARSALSEAVARAERMERRSGAHFRF
jgi:hypothetical protein